MIDFFDDLNGIKKQLESIKMNIEQANTHNEEFGNLERFNSSTEDSIQDLNTQLADLHEYVDELKAQRDQAMNQNKQLMALITRTKAVEQHEGFVQSQKSSHHDSELQSLKETVAAMQKQMSEKNE